MCRIGHAREWSIRILHELKYHDDAIFLTLTYSPEYLPKSGTLIKADLQSFSSVSESNLRKQIAKINITLAENMGTGLIGPIITLLSLVYRWDPMTKR